MQGAEKFCSAAYALYVSKKFFLQHSSWDGIWIFRGAQLFSAHYSTIQAHCSFPANEAQG